MSDFHAGARECCEHWSLWFELFSVATRANERKQTHKPHGMRSAHESGGACYALAALSERSAVQLDARRCTPTALRAGYKRAMLRCPSAARARHARSRRSGPAPTRVRAASPLRRTRALQPQRARRAAAKPPRLRQPSGCRRRRVGAAWLKCAAA
jgi:hypothetical protein